MRSISGGRGVTTSQKYRENSTEHPLTRLSRFARQADLSPWER
jgi:hypothetical protein